MELPRKGAFLAHWYAEQDQLKLEMCSVLSQESLWLLSKLGGILLESEKGMFLYCPYVNS